MTLHCVIADRSPCDRQVLQVREICQQRGAPIGDEVRFQVKLLDFVQLQRAGNAIVGETVLASETV